MGRAYPTSIEFKFLMDCGFAISFSGRIGSGKTNISQGLAQVLCWPRTSFSDYLRNVMAGKGYTDPTRQQLQDLGQSLVEADPDAFCRNVLASVGFVPGGNILLDGIRHVDIQRRIASMVCPSCSVLIHLALMRV